VSLDLAALRAEMPITETWNYLNHATHGPFPRRTVEAVSRVAAMWQSPPELDGGEREETIQIVRRNIASLVNGRPEGVAFTGNLAESISLAASGIDWQPGDNAVVPELEFPSVVYPFLGLEHRGVELRLAPKDENGFTSRENIESVMDGRTRAVAISHVEFRDGFKNDLCALGRTCHEGHALLIVDATQSMGPCVIDLQACGVDVIAAHSYKWLMSSYGVGVMHLSERAIERIRPTYVGRLSVDKHFEDLDYELTWRDGAGRYQTGGINWLSLAALRASTDLIVSIGAPEIEQHSLRLTERLLDGVANKGYHVTSSRDPAHRSAIVSFSTGDLARDGEIVEELKRERIAVSLRGRGVRVSPYFYNTESEINQLVDVLPER
jgi:cysteine desulfurase / selenocysteine lyase